MKTDHKTRFTKWKSLCPNQTQALIVLVNDHVVPALERQGFIWVNVLLRQPDQPVVGRMIELERWAETFVDSITFNFDKYRMPRFQVHGSRRSVALPHNFIRSANLVAKPSQYLHFWGKPWWLPTGLWSQRASLRIVERITLHQPELLNFLETGERKRHVSRAVK